ncbi:DUF6279 family lipoprotein [Deltaproteobacteria bacterium]|nr:DUF6279 family lipoprotein [Deltaproteobacteria bacterium]
MKKIIIFGLLLFLLAGCSTTKLVYDYGDKYLLWQLDSYFDLSNKQEEWLEERIKFHLEWHRSQELRSYKKFLIDIQNRAKNGLTMEELDEGFSRYEAKQQRLFERLIPDTALFLKSLSSEQINNLESKMLEENEEMTEKNENRSELIQERRENFLEQMEEWFGEFSPDQMIQINEWQVNWFAESTSPFEERMKYRIKSQTQILALLRSFPDGQELEKWMRNWSKSWGRDKNSDRKARILRNKNRILQVEKFINPEQRLHALRELDDWIEILEQTISKH